MGTAAVERGNGLQLRESEGNDHLWVEGRDAVRGEVGGGVEMEPVGPEEFAV
jgi:hypothetical protein